MRNILVLILGLSLFTTCLADELSQLKFEQAVRYKDWKVAEELLPKVAIDKRNKYGENALIIATKEGHARLVKWLIDQGAEFDAKAKYGNKIMHVAASNGQQDVIKVLLEKGVDIDASNPHGGTPLILAIHNGHIYTVKFLVRQGANLNKSSKAFTPLITALMEKEYEIAQYLIEKGAYYGNGKDEYGPIGDPIFHASGAPLELFEKLVAGSTSKRTDLRGHAPLVHTIAKTGSLRKLKLLELSGYDLGVKDMHGKTVVSRLKSPKQKDVLAYLVKKGIGE